MFSYNRVILIVMDGVGCGFQPDYRKYNKRKSNTLGSVFEKYKDYNLPNLGALGFNHILFGSNVQKNCAVGKMQEITAGNDTRAGVWEMFGIVRKKRYRSIKKSFSKRLIKKISNNINSNVVGNEYISGFKALDKFYNEHKKTNNPILYISDDGVVLLAAHEGIINPERLNEMGSILADTLVGENISRVITRPFTGSSSNFIRTINRNDFLCDKNINDSQLIKAAEKGILKIKTTEHLSKILAQNNFINFKKGNFNNQEAFSLIRSELKTTGPSNEFQFYCLQDFDMCGHKKDIECLSQKLSELDKEIPFILNEIKDNDLLIITADHGCDPINIERGHTREFVPLIIYSKQLKSGFSLGTRSTFADIGQTICSIFKLPKLSIGSPIYEVI